MENTLLIQTLSSILGDWYTLIFIPCITGIASILAVFTPKIKHNNTLLQKLYLCFYTLIQLLACNIGKAKNLQDTEKLRIIPKRK